MQNIQKFRLFAYLALSAMGLSHSALANNVGVWDSYAAVANSNFAKAKITATQNAIKPKQEQLQTYQANLERLEQQYNSSQGTLSDTQKADMIKQIQSNQQNYVQLAKQIQGNIDSSEAEILQKISPNLQTIIDKIIKQKNIDVLIDSRGSAVSYVKPEWDITKDITKAINEQVK